MRQIRLSSILRAWNLRGRARGLVGFGLNCDRLPLS